MFFRFQDRPASLLTTFNMNIVTQCCMYWKLIWKVFFFSKVKTNVGCKLLKVFEKRKKQTHWRSIDDIFLSGRAGLQVCHGPDISERKAFLGNKFNFVPDTWSRLSPIIQQRLAAGASYLRFWMWIPVVSRCVLDVWALQQSCVGAYYCSWCT